MGFKAQKKYIFSNFFEHTKLIILFELLAYGRTTFHEKILKIEPLRAGFRRLVRKKYPRGDQDN